MSLGRSFWTLTRYARAARFWLFALLALAAFFGCNEARAQSWCGFEPVPTAANPYPTLLEAAAACAAAPSNARSGGIGGGWFVAFTGKSCVLDEANNRVNLVYSSSQDRNNGACEHQPTPPVSGNSILSYYSFNAGCPAGTAWNAESATCQEDCAARPDRLWNPGQVGILNGSTTCDSGCRGIIHKNPSAAGYVVTYAGGGQCEAPPFPEGCSAEQRALGWRNSTIVAGVCVPPTQSCPDGTARDPETGDCGEDACPAGMSLNPQGQCEPQDDTCPAGQVRAPDGSCQNDNDNCPAGQVRGADGTCKPDGNGDGEPDDEVPDSFSGGDSCEAPPTCSGDVIMCGIARINWRIDCNTRKDTKVNGGACNAIPVCVGRNCDALEYAQLLQQWRTSCALERLAEDGIGGGDGGDDDEDGAQACGPGKTDAECEAGQNIGDAGDPGSVMEENEWLASGFDTAGFGWSQSCPAIPSVTVFGTTIDFQSKLGPLCEWVQLGGIFLMIVTGITCLTLLIKV